MDHFNKIPILIVGGGPVGLALATDLGWRGVSCMLVERRDGTLSHPKMNMVSARTMEFCRRWGIGGEVRRLSIAEDFPRNILFVTSANGYELARFEYPSRADAHPVHSPEYLQRCSQTRFDPLLQRRARSFPGVNLLLGHELVSFDQDQNGVTAEIRATSSGDIKTVRAAFLVGCDGADSTVRGALGIPLPSNSALSHSINIFFESDDFGAILPHRKAVIQWVIGPEGCIGGITSVDGMRQWRVGVAHSKPGSTLTEEEAARFIRRVVGRDFEFAVHSILPWTRRRFLADKYRDGRIFLAGDAAHQLSPTGGFGMNTGIGDATDLAWKLAATIQGWAGKRLLESYELERRPIGALAVDEAARNFGALGRIPSGPFISDAGDSGAELRRTVGRFILENGYDREYETDGLTFGYRYESSPIIWPEDGSPPPDDIMTYQPTARPGHRAPHVWLGSGESTLDLFGRGFTLLCIDAAVDDAALWAHAALQCGFPLRIVPLSGTAVHQAYQRRFILVRPDGHVAWRGDELSKSAGTLMERARGN
jgi:2-polyprenyl-6-methoxyphenol hydroxylase-like FAD-dependent oxidoreductase